MCATETTIDGEWVYTYDATGQLTRAVFTPNQSDPDGLTDQNLQYVYDPAGNRTESIDNGVGTTYSVNDMNEYTSTTTAGSGTTTYQYDANGNLVSESGPSGATDYTYNANNQMTGIQGPNGLSENHQYDYFGNLYSSIANGQQTDYLVDPIGDNIVGQYATSSIPVAQYAYGIGLVSQIGGGSNYYYDFDSLGSTTGMTNAAGQYVNSYTYQSFGTVLTAIQSMANPFRFGGEWGVTDNASGMNLMLTRSYDATTGRFVERDTVGFVGGDTNMRRYVNNEPINYFDPTGQTMTDEARWKQGLSAALTIGGGVLNYVELIGLVSASASADVATDGGAAVLTPAEYGLGLYLGANGTTQISLGFTKLVQTIAGQDSQLPSSLPGLVAFAASGGNKEAGDVRDTIDDVFTLITSNPFNMSKREAGPWLLALYNRFASLAGQIPRNVYNSATASSVSAEDPNSLVGPAGYGSSSFVSDDTILPYTINFENAPTATAPAQRVVITDQLSSDLDWTTFELTGIGFGSNILTVPTDSDDYQTSVLMTYNGETFDVEIDAEFDTLTGLLSVVFQSVDPNTDLPPASVLTGFLLPEDGTGRGTGYVGYIIDPESNLPTGTIITNVAQITFDANEPLATDLVNDEDPSQGIDPSEEAPVTIDSGPPTSSVSALSQYSPSQFTVSWSGQDDSGGSGIGSYTIYVCENGGAFTPWLTNTTERSATFDGQVGQTYSFYSVATDNVGNVQPTPSGAQALTTVDPTPPSSTINPLPVSEPGSFPVSWSGSDAGGPGIASYTVYVSVDGGAYKPWLTGTTKTSATFTGGAGNVYAFYSVATDKAGRAQLTPSGSQASTGVAGSVVPANTLLTVSAPAIQLGGITTITLQARDAKGTDELTSDLSKITFSLKNTTGGKGKFGKVSDNKNGSYTATFTSTGDGTNTIVATVDGTAVTLTAPIAVSGAAFGAAKSVVTLGSWTLVAGNTTTVTLQAEDAKGNLETAGGLIVAFKLGSRTDGQGTFRPVIDHGNGTYTATFTGTLAGTNTIKATIDGKAVTSTAPSITVTSGPVSLAKSPLTVSASSMEAGESVTVSFQPEDIGGNKLLLPNQTVNFGMVSGQGNFAGPAHHSLPFWRFEGSWFGQRSLPWL